MILLSWQEHIFFVLFEAFRHYRFVRSNEEIGRKSWNKSTKRLNLNCWLVLYINRLINSFPRGTLGGQGKAAGAVLTGIQGKALPLRWLIGWADARLSRQLCVFCIIKWSIKDPLIESFRISLTDLYFITPFRFFILAQRVLQYLYWLLSSFYILDLLSISLLNDLRLWD